MTLAEMIAKENCTEEELCRILVNRAVEILKEKTGKKSIRFGFKKEAGSILSGKLGGVPFIPVGGEYPVSENDGVKLFLLLQLNFEEMPHIEPYPTKGILQIFIDGREDYCYGLDLDQSGQDTWKVIYHEDISNPMSMEEIKNLMPEISGGVDLPILDPEQEYLLTFTEELMPISTADYRFDKVFMEYCQDILPDEYKGKGLFKLPQDIGNDLCDRLSGFSSRLGGYPGFTQYDPRENNDDCANMELLVQIDSESLDHEDITMWGDCGIGNFFIDEEDLKNLDFTKVLYNWDCC